MKQPVSSINSAPASLLDHFRCDRAAEIAEAAVIGIPNEQWGEVGMAIVAVKPGHTLRPEEIHAHCQANLARFKCPRLIEFVDALPRNATGKIHKPTLRERFNATKATDKVAS